MLKEFPCCENINYLFHLASEIMEADRLHLLLLSDGTRIDENEYLSSLENGIGLTAYTEEALQTSRKNC